MLASPDVPQFMSHYTGSIAGVVPACGRRYSLAEGEPHQTGLSSVSQLHHAIVDAVAALGDSLAVEVAQHLTPTLAAWSQGRCREYGGINIDVNAVQRMQ